MNGRRRQYMYRKTYNTDIFKWCLTENVLLSEVIVQDDVSH